MFVVVVVVLWMVAVVLASSWALSALLRLVWRPRAITRMFRAQGVHGPEYRFLLGNIGEMNQLLGESASLVLDVGCHDYSAMVQPYFQKWMAHYGTYIHVYINLVIYTPSLRDCLKEWYLFCKVIGAHSLASREQVN